MGFLQGLLNILAPQPPNDPRTMHCGRLLDGCFPPEAVPGATSRVCACTCDGCSAQRAASAHEKARAIAEAQRGPKR